MDIRDLYYFQSIAEHEHMGQAARSLFLTQPALTKAVRRLEESIGAPLFTRTGRRIVLTELGKLLLKRTYSLRQHMDDTAREIKSYAHGQSGLIRLGCAPTMTKYLLPEILPDFLREAPGVSIDLYSSMSGDLLSQLNDRVLDLAITHVTGPLVGYSVTPLVSDTIVVVAGRNHPIFRKKYTIGDVAQYSWILPRGSGARPWLRAMMAKYGYPAPVPQIEASSIIYLPRLISGTNLLSLLSRRNLVGLDDGGLLREVDLTEARLRRVFCLVHSADDYLSPAAQKLVDLLCAKRDSDVPAVEDLGRLMAM